MRERPTGEELLAVARKVLLEELMPLLPDDRRYDTLMIANAMGIAARQMAFGNEAGRRERHDLIKLLGETETNGRSREKRELYRVLCAGIRNGEFDPGRTGYSDLQHFLHEVTVQRLRESAPKILNAAGIT